MIEIKIKIDKNKLLNELIAKGHSGFDKKGNDILCASVSTLLETAMLSFKKLPLVELVKEDNGKIYRLKLKKINNEIAGEIRGITIFLITGLMILSGNFEKNLKIKIID